MAKQHLCDVGVAEYRDVDQWGVAKFIDGVDIGAALGEEPDGVCESFDRQKVERRFAVKPACVDEIRMRRQQFGRSRLVLDGSVDEFADERSRQGPHA